MITENLSTLKIHKLTQEQYERELSSGNIDENALYLTPEEEIDLSCYATVERVEQIETLVGDASVSEQISSATGSIRDEVEMLSSRVDEVIALEPDNTIDVYQFENRYGDSKAKEYSGTLTSNGINAHIHLYVVFRAGFQRGSIYEIPIPAEFFPMIDNAALPISGPKGLSMICEIARDSYTGEPGVGPLIRLTNVHEELEAFDTETSWTIDAFYPLSNVSMAALAQAEVVDVRVGYDGTVYETAGESVRKQVEQAMAEAADKIVVDEELSSDSSNPVASKAVSSAVANALKGSIYGERMIRMDKVSSLEHELDVRLSSKNQANHGEIIPNSYYRDTNYSFTDCTWGSRFEPFACKPNTTYTMSSNSLFYSVQWLDKDKKWITGIYLGGKYQPYTFTTLENCYYIALTVYNKKNGEPNPFEWLQLEEGTVETPYTPPVPNLNGIALYRYGKNLCDNTRFMPYDGTITLLENGFTYTGRYYCLLDGSFLSVGSYYCMSWKFESESSLTPVWRLQYQDGTFSSHIQNGAGITITKPVEVILLYHSTDGGTYTATFTDVQLEMGTVATQYEPYHFSEYAAGADGSTPGVHSVSPVTTLDAGPGICIAAEYNKDTAAVVEELMERITALEAAIVNN